MRFKITNKTLASEFPYLEELSQDDKIKILKCSKFDFGAITVSEFFDIIGGALPKCIMDKMTDKMTVVDYVTFTFGLERFLEFYTKELEKLIIKPTAEEERAARGVVQPTFQENILFFLRNYFNCRTFAEAETLTLTDYLLSAKDNYIRMKIERNLSDVFKNKSKIKK